jgi:ubiquinone/menaquinone biosynthesis C-methylase UbiE
MKSNIEWNLWGKQDPLYGVASWSGRERDGANPWTDDEFYALGADWLDFKVAWQRTVGYSAGTVLEVGSGAGRITRMLAETFEQVIATDVSEDMLSYARARISAPNVSWQLSNGDRIPAANDSVDATFSCHVFQHFPDTASQLATFQEIFRVLRPRGTFFIHLPIHAFPEVNRSYTGVARICYSAFLNLSSARAAMRRSLIRAGLKRPYMHGVSYEMQPLFRDLAGLGFADVAVSAITVRTAPGIHCCVSGRKP